MEDEIEQRRNAFLALMVRVAALDYSTRAPLHGDSRRHSPQVAQLGLGIQSHGVAALSMIQACVAC